MLLAIFVFGMRLEDLSRAERMEHLPVHAGLGLTLLALVLIRLGWRLRHPAPPYPDSMSPRQQKWARWVVHAFYALMIAQPLLGFMQAATYVDFEIRAFGALNVTALLPSHADVTAVFHVMHGTCAWLLALLVIGHVGATLKHAFWDKDGVPARMMLFVKVPK
jgi:cytochrome b561